MARRPTSRRSHPGPALTFASLLRRRAGLRTVRFAVPVRDYPSIARAKLRFGSVAVARLLSRLYREVLTLCPAVEAR